MAHPLNTNKQFMVGNGILAFAVLFVVVLFVFVSLRMSREKGAEKSYAEQYTVVLSTDFVGDSITLFLNDSLILNQQIAETPVRITVGRFADQSALLVVDNRTEQLSTFDLSEKGGTYTFAKDAAGAVVLTGR